jgi:Peptidase S24-like
METSLVKKSEDGGGLWQLFPYQRPSLLFRGHVVHQDGAEVGQSRKIVGLLLWGYLGSEGGRVLVGSAAWYVEDGESEWVAVDAHHRLRPGMFVAQVVGKSMEPMIPDGALCLFRSPVEGTRQGKNVLVQLRHAIDPETGERYTVKRYESEKARDGDSWQHEKIRLRPVNPAFEPIVLTGPDAGELQVVAELVEVLGDAP